MRLWLSLVGYVDRCPGTVPTRGDLAISPRPIADGGGVRGADPQGGESASDRRFPARRGAGSRQRGNRGFAATPKTPARARNFRQTRKRFCRCLCCRPDRPSSTAMSNAPTAPTAPSSGSSTTAISNSRPCKRRCGPGRRRTITSGRTKPWATKPPPSTSPHSAPLRCSGRPEREHPIDRPMIMLYCANAPSRPARPPLRSIPWTLTGSIP